MAQYVNIKSSFEEGEEVISLPTDNNGCLLINTLNSFGFRGVDGLKFINPVTRRITGIEKDTTGTKFSPPAFGWGNEDDPHAENARRLTIELLRADVDRLNVRVNDNRMVVYVVVGFFGAALIAFFSHLAKIKSSDSNNFNNGTTIN